MVRIILIRHGMTEWNIVGRVQGRSDVPLADEGRELAREKGGAVRALCPVAAFSSPLVRSLETAEIMLEGGAFTVDARLTERNFGLLDGQTYELLSDDLHRNLFADLSDHPDAEQADEMFARARSFVEALREGYDGQTVAVFCHAVVISFLAYAASHREWNAADYSRTYVKNCEFAEGTAV